MVAGGRGTRLGGPLPKQFAPLGDATVLAHAVRSLSADPRVAGLCLVLPEDEVGSERGRAAAALPGVLQVVAGGDSRADSVRRGLYGEDDPAFNTINVTLGG